MCIRDSINAALVADPELLAACETFATTNQPAILDAVHARAPRAQVYWTTLYLSLIHIFPAC